MVVAAVALGRRSRLLPAESVKSVVQQFHMLFKSYSTGNLSRSRGQDGTEHVEGKGERDEWVSCTSYVVSEEFSMLRVAN